MPVKMTIVYSDGKTFAHEWPPCRVFGLGASDVGDFGVKPKKGVSIDLIVIEAEGRTIHRFDKEQINSLIEDHKKEKKYPIWVIDESGINFSTNRKCSLIKSS